jgi:hypothetical protein
MRNVIFCPVGIPLNYHDAYDKDNHWRKTNGIQRNYETVVYQYKDFDIEPNTYDQLVRDTGFKWDLAKHFLDTFDYRDYDYIGFWDDDLVTDIQSVNRALEIATKKDIKMFQMSTIAGSESTHRILHQVPGYSYSLTNFNEGMGGFFHSSLIPILLDFWNYHEVKSGWGFDIILAPIMKQKAGVMHEVSMYHPNRPSYYDKSAAFAEMGKILGEVYPKFMKDRYNEEVGPYSESQTEYEFTFKAS